MAAASAAVVDTVRPHVGGTFLYLRDQTLSVRGVAYGTFHPTAEGAAYQDPERVERNFAQMAANGLYSYLARLQNIADERPLVVAEIGLDSHGHGPDAQARTTFAAGCAGAFVCAWSDVWYRGGQDSDDWDFGLTDRERRPKPALAVRAAHPRGGMLSRGGMLYGSDRCDWRAGADA